MKFLLPPLVSPPRSTFRCRRTCRKSWMHSLTRRMSQHCVRDETVLDISRTFEGLGLHPPIVASLRAAFPNVVRPTEAQIKFIPAVLADKDVLLRDETGSGKSFGLILALLNKPRLRSVVYDSKNTSHITSLVIVPHRDLAFQLLYWIERIVASAVNPNTPPPPLLSVAQVLVRDGGSHLGSGLASLREHTPHILIGTPQALMDVYRANQNILQLSDLSCVVVDEVDYLISTIPRKDPAKSFRGSFEKAVKAMQAHPGPTRELLNIIYAPRQKMNDRRRDMDLPYQKQLAGDSRMPQLVLSSATMRAHFNHYLFNETGWLNPHNFVKVSPPANANSFARGGSSLVSHSILVVSDKSIRNVLEAVQVESDKSMTEGQELTPDVVFASPVVVSPSPLEPAVVEKYASTPSPFPPSVMEAIATAFALDVPSVALLVVPASSSVRRAVYDFQAMGVNAHPLDLLKEDRGRQHLLKIGATPKEDPILLIGTLSTIRGVDLPELTHVFLLGIPDGPTVNGRSVDAYVHISGRVGRFGRGGKVISIVQGVEGELEDKGNTAPSESSKMLRILNTIKVTPARFEHFD